MHQIKIRPLASNFIKEEGEDRTTQKQLGPAQDHSASIEQGREMCRVCNMSVASLRGSKAVGEPAEAANVVASESAFTFWSWRTLVLWNHSLNSTYVKGFLCLFAVLLIFPVMLLIIIVILNHVTSYRPHPNKTHAVLKQSILEGIVVLADGVEVRAFLGVPYAKALGRFQTSQFVLEAPPSVIDATRPAAACPQGGSLDLSYMSEDCLNLNIWTPNSQCHEGGCGNRTVLFFLHGGFFQVGSNSEHVYDGRFLSAAGNMVVVVPNYRLGAFGFLKYRNIHTPGNVGLLDQLLALAWVRENIADVGGDVSNIVLVGHESGAASVGYHLYEAYETLKVRRAVLLSGSPFTRYPDHTGTWLELVQKLAAVVSCPTQGDQVLTCLKSLPTSTLVNVKSVYFFPTSMWPEIAEKATQVAGMDILLGYAGNEGGQLERLYLRYLTSRLLKVDPTPVCTTTKILQWMGFHLRAASRIADLYVSGFGGSREFWVQDMLADILVVCPVQYYAERLVSKGNRVYLYFAFHQNASRSMNVQHWFVTDNLFNLRASQHRSREELSLSKELVRFFADFVNGVGLASPKRILSGGTSFVVEDFGEASAGEFRRVQCDFLRQFYFNGEHLLWQ